jgi:hypothetical protein
LTVEAAAIDVSFIGVVYAIVAMGHFGGLCAEFAVTVFEVLLWGLANLAFFGKKEIRGEAPGGNESGRAEDGSSDQCGNVGKCRAGHGGTDLAIDVPAIFCGVRGQNE